MTVKESRRIKERPTHRIQAIALFCLSLPTLYTTVIYYDWYEVRKMIFFLTYSDIFFSDILGNLTAEASEKLYRIICCTAYFSSLMFFLFDLLHHCMLS